MKPSHQLPKKTTETETLMKKRRKIKRKHTYKYMKKEVNDGL